MSRSSILGIEPFHNVKHDALPDRRPKPDRNGVADEATDDLPVDGIVL